MWAAAATAAREAVWYGSNVVMSECWQVGGWWRVVDIMGI